MGTDLATRDRQDTPFRFVQDDGRVLRQTININKPSGPVNIINNPSPRRPFFSSFFSFSPNLIGLSLAGTLATSGVIYSLLPDIPSITKSDRLAPSTAHVTILPPEKTIKTIQERFAEIPWDTYPPAISMDSYRRSAPPTNSEEPKTLIAQTP